MPDRNAPARAGCPTGRSRSLQTGSQTSFLIIQLSVCSGASRECRTARPGAATGRHLHSPVPRMSFRNSYRMIETIAMSSRSHQPTGGRRSRWCWTAVGLSHRAYGLPGLEPRLLPNPAEVVARPSSTGGPLQWHFRAVWGGPRAWAATTRCRPPRVVSGCPGPAPADRSTKDSGGRTDRAPRWCSHRARWQGRHGTTAAATGIGARSSSVRASPEPWHDTGRDRPTVTRATPGRARPLLRRGFEHETIALDPPISSRSPSSPGSRHGRRVLGHPHVRPWGQLRADGIAAGRSRRSSGRTPADRLRR